MADFRDSLHLARLVLRERQRGRAAEGQSATGAAPRRMEMDRFESFAFIIGFVATVLLTVVGQAVIV
jgi:hypothetical protein